MEILGETNEDLALRNRTLSGQNALGIHLVETGASSCSKAKVNAKPSTSHLHYVPDSAVGSLTCLAMRTKHRV